MVLKEITGNIFEVESNEDVYFIHCLSKDWYLGAEIARQFQDKYKIMEQLKEIFHQDKDNYIKSKVILTGRIFNMFTKTFVFQKSTYSSIETCLNEVKSICSEKNISYLAMPKIGCGIDGLCWSKVKRIIESVFNDSNIEISIYSLENEEVDSDGN